MDDQPPLYPEIDCLVEQFEKKFGAIFGPDLVIRGACNFDLDNPPSQETTVEEPVARTDKAAEYSDIMSQEATVEELVARLDEKMRCHRAALYQGVLSRCNLFKLMADRAEARLAADIRQFGELPDGYSYRSEWAVALWSQLSDKFELLHENIRGAVIKIFMEEANYSTNAFLALERVIISDHERRKIEPRHARSAKARFQDDAIQKFKSRNKNKRAFSVQYSGQLYDLHKIIIDPRTIAEDWLKGV